jgi:predicted MFS family arabinose efflux permease
VLADGVAIVVGRLLHRRLPERFLHGVAALLFLLFGLWMLFDNALGWPTVAVASTAGVAAVAVITAVVRYMKSRRRAPARESSPEITA